MTSALPKRSLLAALAMLAAPATSSAQVVRGRITEVNTSAPVAGALVSLLPASGDSVIVNVLSATSGEYGIRAPAAGTYRLAVKRIGVRRYTSAPFELGAGETRMSDVRIDAVAIALPEVNVSGLCVTRQRDLPRVASLWDEARTALEAADISLRDRLIEARLSRHAAELDPATLQVRFDWRSDAQLMVQQPFTSPSGDSLSAIGYWRQLPGDSVEYLAPDARALASNAFIRDHCFSLSAAPRNRPELVGLAFRPSRDRRLPDITGTIWIDARRFELRFIEFRYTMLPAIPNADRVGGEVHFTRLASGAWIVDRWFIRMPQVIVLPDDWPRRQLREEGGSVVAAGVSGSARRGTLTGVFRDSAGRPLQGAVVRAVGTHHQVMTAADGTWRLDSLPAGGVSVVVHTDGYDSFGVLAGSRRVELQAGRTQRADMRAPDTAALRAEVCPVAPRAFTSQRRVNRGMMRLLMVDSATAVPLPGVRFLAVWPALSEDPSADSTRERYRQAITDSRGAATFCDLPTGFPLDVLLVGAGGGRAHVMLATLEPGGVLNRVVTGRVTR